MSHEGLVIESFRQHFFKVTQVAGTAMLSKVFPAVRLWTFFVGMTLSFTVGVWWCRYFVPLARPRGPNAKQLCDQLQERIWGRPLLLHNEIKTKEFVFIGVMTSQKFLTTRAKGVYDTWGRNVPGRLIFFAGKGKTMPRVDFPVVYLPVPDNVHPPQRKSLAMLQYIHDNFIDSFQWFIRADDDVYMRTKKMVAFLRTLDSSETLLLGQAGLGKRHERGRLGLRNGDNFCIGGPGVVMSSGVLRKVSPHLGHCSNHTATFHEDTEVGRCLRHFAGVMCPWAYEARELFHQVYENQDQAYHGSLASSVINNAITLHPIKDPAYMRRLHVHYLTMETQELNHRAWFFDHQVHNLKEAAEKRNLSETTFQKSLDFFGGISAGKTLSWEMFRNKQVYSLVEKAPLRWIHDSVRDGLLIVVRRAKKLAQRQAVSTRYHSLRFQNNILGYLSNHATLGCQYIIRLGTVNIIKRSRSTRPKKSASVHWFKFQQPFAPLRYCLIGDDITPIVHFVVPLAGRLENFRRFLASFEKSFLHRDKNVKLLVVYFPKLGDPSEHKRVLRMYVKRYPQGVFHWLNVHTRKFQRGLALNLGSKYFGKGMLLSFADVDLVFQSDYLLRCRGNTKQGERVYFPIMFSQFHPNITSSDHPLFNNTFTFHRDSGLWRIYSYGPVCVYSDDVLGVGGFNTSIKGWGLEDVEFFQKFVKKTKMDVIRAPDRGLVHVFHKHAPCSPRSTFKQQKMCRDAKADYTSSASSAVGYLVRKQYLNLNEDF